MNKKYLLLILIPLSLIIAFIFLFNPQNNFTGFAILGVGSNSNSLCDAFGEFHNYGGGASWRVTKTGVEVIGRDNQIKAETSCPSKVLSQYSAQIQSA